MDDIERKLWADVYAARVAYNLSNQIGYEKQSAEQEATWAVEALREAAAKDET